MKVGIIGRGFVGEAMYQSFTKRGVDVVSYDKYKENGGKFGDVLGTEIIFLCLPTPYVEGYGYDLSPIKETLCKLRYYTGIIVLKSTIEPGVTRRLSEEYNFGDRILHNPEFLTARTANEDFDSQTYIVIGHTKRGIVSTRGLELAKFYSDIYQDAKIIQCTSEESEAMKIMANSWYSIKVQAWNEFYFLCQKVGADYKMVRKMIIDFGWTNPMHTDVPGPDGQFSYSGFCFPKDTSALNHLMETLGTPNEVLAACIKERDRMRKD